MIPAEKAREFINKHDRIAIPKEDFERFSEPYRILGLYISNQLSEYYDYSANFRMYEEQFGTDPKTNPWNTKEGGELANLLFGTKMGPYIVRIWDLMDRLPFQDRYSRRPFRIDPSRAYSKTKLGRLNSLYYGGYTSFNTMDPLDQMQYDVYQNVQDIGLYYALLLMDEPQKYYPLLEEMFLGEHEIGGVSTELIRALLLTEDDANHLLVEKVLLAAQQQEGLRQTILETLDFTSVKALKRFIRLILEHNLVRFSSVVRAVDTWFGFGWEAPKAATIKRTLELALQFLDHPEQVEGALQSKDNLELYVALWSKAIVDVDEANAAVVRVVTDEKSALESKLVALFFMRETERTNSDLIDYAEAHAGEDIELDYWLLVNLFKHDMSDTLLAKYIATAAKLPSAGKTYTERGFSWKSYTIKPENIYDGLFDYLQPHQFVLLANDLGAVPSSSRERLMRKLFPDHYTYSWSFQSNGGKVSQMDLQEDDWQRKVIRQAIVDRNTSVSFTGINLMRSVSILAEDIVLLESLLTRKGKELRQASMGLLLLQPTDTLKDVLSRLLVSSSVDQRLGGLEMLTMLQDKAEWADFILEQKDKYAARKAGKNESILLAKLDHTAQGSAFTLANGFGAIDYSGLTDFRLPKLQFEQPKKKLLSFKKSDFLFPELIDVKKTVKGMNKLYALFDENRKTEYTYEGYQGSQETTMLMNSITHLKRLEEDSDPMQRLDNLPLADLWKSWYKEAGLNDFELYAVIWYIRSVYNRQETQADLKAFQRQYIPEFESLNYDKVNYFYYSDSNKIITILTHLLDAYADKPTWTAYKLDVLEDSIARFSEELKGMTFNNVEYYYNQQLLWTDLIGAMFYPIMDDDYAYYDEKQLLRLYQLRLYITAQQLAQGRSIEKVQDVVPFLNKVFDTSSTIKVETPGFELLFKAYSLQLINNDDLLFLSLLNKDLFFLLDGGQNYHTQRLKHYTMPEINGLLKKNMLTVELERGDMPTEASPYMAKIQLVEGTSYFFEVLQRMGKENFDRGYSYGGGTDRKYTFSHILKKCRPAEEELFGEFAKQLKASKLEKKRLVEVSCYATQWADWLGDYMQIPSLEEAVWWFLAHTTDYMDAEKETILSRYSNVPRNDFQKGAIDIDWFKRVYANLGKANWKLLHESAKYLSDGMGYRRVKTYSSVLLGETKITETLKKINEKRDKDYVMALGLIPISKANPEGDLLKRYTILQTFLKESKQFGAQRQESEKNAVEIGLDNLARNAGFDDSIRFVWAMEGKATQQIMQESVVEVDDVRVELVVNEEGKADLQVSRKDKALKSIPDKYKKNKLIEALKDGKTYLTKQFSRTKLALENSMLRRDRYSVAELRQIMEHPIVRAMLSKLVLYIPNTQKAGFWSASGLMDTDGKAIVVTDMDELVIAHPYDLFHSVQWDLFQRYLFVNEMKQPFKQVFRELYVPTADEMEQRTRSTRYQGHQIQPQKTVALLRGRGWTVSYEEGLQKVFHKEGYLVTMFAMADWFTPSDVEAPTLELICFYSLKDRSLLPFEAIDPVIFSEVMRDMDLVVSVAHVGEVDPEASHSSMEMRAALARESAQLFGLDNIEVKDRHILVSGKLAEYSIHLGSGMVSKGGRQLSIIPVHSQHRGRVFLPFVDDDPKSAEIISKMRYLAQDDKIKDPTILEQINA
ncbi:DUF4132 domain-containing protein [Sphingobacterium faecale]|uniref:DUF4132 domain-containing protein n=1 Tax=Sphingobacterium faecale TaxID=2803775 RepID=A0ABS1R4E9_9SPHI|nr:DUF4132 domain-containing protein [Sphingobacterium faecale]MBL1409424.1 DUF4132 domain-containing protein [Sphingobacterium faecale]